MNDQDLKSIRNIGIIAHIDAGKTTISERILFYCQKIHRMGEVHDGTATMDYMPEEQERGITISSACTTCKWQNYTLNLIDTPGHVDFTIEVERSLRVLDGAIGIFCAVGGVEPQSETVWRQSENFKIPKLAFINKMDRIGANFENTISSISSRLNANPVALTIPCGSGETFSGIFDLITEKKLIFSKENQGQDITYLNANENELEQIEFWREQLLEKLAENNDHFLELWLNHKFTNEDIIEAIKQATYQRKITPVFCGSALKNIGVQPLIDAICEYLPSPSDIDSIEGINSEGNIEKIVPSINNDCSALVFKIIMENGRKLALLRIYSGCIKEGDNFYNITRNSTDRIAHIYTLHADRKEQRQCAYAGEIVAIIGLKSAHTGDTFNTKKTGIILENISKYSPVLTLALEPKNADEGNNLDNALQRFSEEDPTLKIAIDEDSGTRMVSGMGELHLEILLERIAREYNIKPRYGQPQVVLRETITQNANAACTFDKQLGKEHHQGCVSVSVAPLPRGSGNSVKIGDFLPKEEQQARKILPTSYLQSALDGINDRLQCGELTGWPIVDVEVTLTNIERTENLTTIPGCHMAAGQALQEALKKANSVALEPIMNVEIIVPENFLGDSISLLNSCNGKILEIIDHTDQKLLRGSAPLRNLFGFATKLRSSTQGRAGLSLSFHSFDQA